MRMKRLPNNFGSITKLPGQRRKPWAVRMPIPVRYLYFKPEGAPPGGIRASNRGKDDFWKCRDSPMARDVLADAGIPFVESVESSYKYLAYFEKERDALDYLTRLHAGQAVPDREPRDSVPTFAAIYDGWRSMKLGLKKQLSDSAWRGYNAAFKDFSPLHDKRISLIKADELREILNGINGMSISKVNNAKKLLKAMYAYAVKNGYAEKDLSGSLIYEYEPPKEEKHRRFTEPEVRLLWSRQDDDIIALILLYICTGMRPNELFCINSENTHVNEGYVVGGLKTANGKDRVIPIPPPAREIAARYFSGTLCPGIKNYDQYSRAFRAAMVNFRMSHLPHDTRHTFSYLTRDINENIRKRIMGHSLKKDITEDVYTQLSPADIVKAVQDVDFWN